MYEPDLSDIFYIRDNSEGFDMHYADRLFGIFHRLHSERYSEDTGIRLVIVRYS